MQISCNPPPSTPASTGHVAATTPKNDGAAPPAMHNAHKMMYPVNFIGTKREEDAFNVQGVDLSEIQDLFIAKACSARVWMGI
jgi:hypothetical protein